MGRYFCSNADLVERLREGKPLHRYSEFRRLLSGTCPDLADKSCRTLADRARFYGPFKQNEIGYTVHPEQLGEGVPMPLGD